MKNKRNIIKFSLISGLTAFSIFSVNTFKLNTKNFSLNSDLLVKAADSDINHDSNYIRSNYNNLFVNGC